MDLNLKKSDLVFRKLKISDYKKFEKLFYSSFKKKISYDFFKWRYFSDKYSFCYGAFISSELIANVGMKSMRLNNKKTERIYSRHSSMVLKKYRGKGIFSSLLNEVKQKFLPNLSLVVMWPNKNNFSTFGINRKYIIKKKYYLHKVINLKVRVKNTEKININKLNKFKIFLKNDNNFFFKDYNYFSKRYLCYNKNEYFINKFELKKLKSFFILKEHSDKSGLNYVVLDHFGSKKIKQIHLKHLLYEKKKIIFWSERKIHKLNHSLINCFNLNIGLIKKFDVQKKLIQNKEFTIGDTDSFITIK